MITAVHSEQGVIGPGDLTKLRSGTVTLFGKVSASHDYGRWAPMLGTAILNGVTIEWSEFNEQ